MVLRSNNSDDQGRQDCELDEQIESQTPIKMSPKRL